MKTFLIATDFSDASRNASIYGIELARAVNAKIILVNVYPYVVPTADSAIMITDEELEDNSREKLVEEKEWLSNRLDVEITTISDQGKVGEMILSVAKDVEASWIIAGMKGGSRLARLIFGGTSFMLSRHSEIPLMLVPENARFTTPKTIAFASDITEDTCIHILDPLKEFGKSFSTTMYIVRVIEKGMNDVFERLLRPSMLTWHFKKLHPSYEFLNDNDVAHAMSGFVKEHNVDIVAMICHKHNLLERIFNKSNIKEMILHTQVPLMILPGKVTAENMNRNQKSELAEKQLVN